MRITTDVDPATSKAAKCREELDQLLGSYIDDPRELRDVHRALDDLIEALNDRDTAGAQDMSPDAVAARIVDPARSRLNALSRSPNPSRYVR
jgi:cytochrome P450